jgi:hypothetical protein
LIKNGSKEEDYEKINSVPNSPIIHRARVCTDREELEIKRLDKMILELIDRVQFLEKLTKRHQRWLIIVRWAIPIVVLFMVLKRGK